MPLPKSINAYNDCVDVYDRAITSVEAGGSGVRVRLNDYAAAIYFRMRMNNARAINRRDNADAYEPGHPLYKGSVWDSLMVTIKQIDDEYYVYVEPHGIDASAVEEIPSDGEVVTKVTMEKSPKIGEIQPLVSRR